MVKYNYIDMISEFLEHVIKSESDAIITYGAIHISCVLMQMN